MNILNLNDTKYIESLIVRKEKMRYKISTVLNHFAFGIFLIANCIASEDIGQYKLRTSRVLSDLQEHIQFHKSHMEDYKSTLSSMNENDVVDIINDNIQVILEYKNIIDMSIQVQKNLNNVAQFEHFLDTVCLPALLEMRLVNLHGRKKQSKDLQKRKNEGEKFIKYAWTTDPKRRDELNEIEKLFADITTDKYQTINKIIVNLLSLTCIQRLSNSKKLIRNSPSLWPLIQTPNNDDWGHPDEAIFEKQDVDLYEYYLFKAGKLITKPESVIRRESVIYPLFSQTFISPPSSSSSEATPTTEEDLKKIAKKKEDTAKKNKARREREKSKKLTEKAHSNQVDAINSDLDENYMDDLLSTQVAATPEQQKELPTASCTESTQHTTESPLTIAKVAESLEAAPALTSEQNQFLKASDSEDEFVARSKYDPRAEHQMHQSLKNLEMTTKGVEDAEENDNATATAIARVRNVHLQTINHIFDNTAFHPISYAQFESLWINRGGSIPDPKSGGSHRSLYWNGQKVGSTFKPHGGHDYGPRCIKYLKNALEKIMPPSLLSQLQGHK